MLLVELVERQMVCCKSRNFSAKCADGTEDRKNTTMAGGRRQLTIPEFEQFSALMPWLSCTRQHPNLNF